MASKAAAASSSKRAREVRFRNLTCELQFSNPLLPSKNQDTLKDSNCFLFKGTTYHSLQLLGVKQNFNAGSERGWELAGWFQGQVFRNGLETLEMERQVSFTTRTTVLGQKFKCKNA